MLYWSDDGDLMSLRYNRWKANFMEQRHEGLKIWSEPLVKLRMPTIVDLRSDPFEKAPMGSIYHSDWMAHRMFLFVPAQAIVAQWVSSFKEFPPRQKPASFSIDEVMKKLEATPSGK
jgi:arylsulfatase